MTKPIAILPARGGSKRFPRKNIALLQGRPLLAYPIDVAVSSGLFSAVTVSTEDDEIARIAIDCGATSFRRHESLATDTAHELDACIELIDEMANPPEYVCLIYPTAALVRPDDLTGAYEMVKQADAPCVVMATSSFNYHPYKALVEGHDGKLSMLFPEQGRQRSQNYPKTVASNGMFYWVHVETIRQNRAQGYYQENLYAYEIPAARAIDVDYPHDLAKLEEYLSHNVTGVGYGI